MGEIILDYPDGPHLIAKGLIKGRDEGPSQKKEVYDEGSKDGCDVF